MNTEQILEFDKVRERWKDLALTEAAKDKIAQSTYFLEESKLRKS